MVLHRNIVNVDKDNQYIERVMAKSPLFLTAAEAAAELGVSRPTLYAYVSRGLILSEAARGRRTKLYRAEDIRNLRDRRDKGRSADEAAESALHLGLPVLESGVTLIADGVLYYRGRDAVALAREATLEAVATLLWNARSDPFAGPLPVMPKVSGPSAVARAMQALASAAVADARAYNTSPEGIAETGARILRLLVAAFFDRNPTRGPIHVQMAQACGKARGDLADFFRRALVLLADHELNASTFAARVVASTGANPYLGVLGGLAALQGPRHGGNVGRVVSFLNDAEAARSPALAVERRLRDGERLPGFGHPLYPAGDPRARAMIDHLTKTFGRAGRMATALEVAKAGTDLAGVMPNVDFALAAAIRAYDLADDTGLAVFAIARSVGWIAHVGEQARDRRVIRPRARYVGDRPAISLQPATGASSR